MALLPDDYFSKAETQASDWTSNRYIQQCPNCSAIHETKLHDQTLCTQCER